MPRLEERIVRTKYPNSSEETRSERLQEQRLLEAAGGGCSTQWIFVLDHPSKSHRRLQNRQLKTT